MLDTTRPSVKTGQERRLVSDAAYAAEHALNLYSIGEIKRRPRLLFTHAEDLAVEALYAQLLFDAAGLDGLVSGVRLLTWLRGEYAS